MPNPWQRQATKRKVISQQEVQRGAAPYVASVGGSMAFTAGLSPVNCPYILGTSKWKAWYAGWAFRFDQKQEADARWGKGIVHLL